MPIDGVDGCCAVSGSSSSGGSAASARTAARRAAQSGWPLAFVAGTFTNVYARSAAACIPSSRYVVSASVSSCCAFSISPPARRARSMRA
jgi:hypothetical protein